MVSRVQKFLYTLTQEYWYVFINYDKTTNTYSWIFCQLEVGTTLAFFSAEARF